MTYRVYAYDLAPDGDVVSGLATDEEFGSWIEAWCWAKAQLDSPTGFEIRRVVERMEGDGTSEAARAV